MRVLVACLLLAGCSRGFTGPSDSMVLPIADRRWDPEAPEEGWCGETSIQLAAGWYGAYVSQAHVNEFGHPKTKDLWEHDVPVALEAMHLRFERGPTERAAMLKWAVEQLRQQHPVVLGLKIVPTEHPEWKVDHLVLAVGFSPQGLLIDTNAEEGQITVSWAGLQRASGDQEYSLVNESGEVFAFAVSGFEPPSQVPVHVHIVSQRDTLASIDVTATNLHVGTKYEMRLGGNPADPFVAEKTEFTRRIDVPVGAFMLFSAREAAAK